MPMSQNTTPGWSALCMIHAVKLHCDNISIHEQQQHASDPTQRHDTASDVY